MSHVRFYYWARFIRLCLADAICGPFFLPVNQMVATRQILPAAICIFEQNFIFNSIRFMARALDTILNLLLSNNFLSKIYMNINYRIMTC